jgi:hypothetical protein
MLQGVRDGLRGELTKTTAVVLGLSLLNKDGKDMYKYCTVLYSTVLYLVDLISHKHAPANMVHKSKTMAKSACTFMS